MSYHLLWMIQIQGFRHLVVENIYQGSFWSVKFYLYAFFFPHSERKAKKIHQILKSWWRLNKCQCFRIKVGFSYQFASFWTTVTALHHTALKWCIRRTSAAPHVSSGTADISDINGNHYRNLTWETQAPGEQLWLAPIGPGVALRPGEGSFRMSSGRDRGLLLFYLLFSFFPERGRQILVPH